MGDSELYRRVVNHGMLAAAQKELIVTLGFRLP